MIDAAMAETVRPGIIHFCTKYDDLSDQFLSHHDWQMLGTFHRFLKYFDTATGRTQGYHATVDRVLPTMEYILEQLEAGKKEFTGDEIMGPCINAAWGKIIKYYDITDRSTTYTASVVLNPTQKWQAFSELQWSDEWITAARKQVGSLWEKEYKKKEPDALPGSIGIAADLELTDFDIWMESKRERVLDEDEYARYCSSQRIDLRKGVSFDARKWWSETSRRLEYPNLSKMALDLLSIPAMSASPERLFSTAKLTVTDRRNRLSPQGIEALECLKSWYKIGRLGDNMEFTQPGMQ